MTCSERLGPVQALRTFARARPRVERCELCSLELPQDHPHLLEIATRRLACCCQACGVLFDQEQGGRFRRVPRTIEALVDFRLDDAAWDRLQLPVGLAFFYRDSGTGNVVAHYPSPAGAMESLLDLSVWQAILADNPGLQTWQSDVEALLVNRMRQARACYRVPIDECYRLIGLIRLNWEGLTGGDRWQQVLAEFFAELDRKAGPLAKA